MEYVAVAFRSRSETVAFSKFLKRYGIYCEIINTPKEAGVGCGLSIKIDKNYFRTVKRAVFAFNGSSFAGFFLVRTFGGKRRVSTI